MNVLLKNLLKRRGICFIAVFLIYMSYAKAETFEIKVDASKRDGRVPELLTSSVWITHPSEKDVYILNKFFKENRPATIQLTIPLGGVDFKSFKVELAEYLKNPGISIIIEKSNKYGTTLIIGFDPAPMRSWLSSRPGDVRKIGKNNDGFTIEQTSPPANYSKWSEVVGYTLKYFKNNLGVKKLGFFVGHEPNRDWLGSEESLFKYYAASAQAAKAVSESIYVGGIGPWSVTGEMVGCEYPHYAPYVRDLCRKEGGWADSRKEPILKNFIEYVAEHHLPLDFVNWHSFGRTPASFLEDADTIRGWIKQAGITGKNVILYPSDWTYWANAYPADYLDTSESAAYIMHALYYMWKGGIDWHGHDFNVFDEGLERAITGARGNSTFIGDWSLFAKSSSIGGGIVKPMYNAFKALTIFAGNDGNAPNNLISTTFPERKTIIALSSIRGDSERISTMVANFVPVDRGKLKTHLYTEIMKSLNISEKEKMILKKRLRESKKETKGKRKEYLLSGITDPEKIETIDFVINAYNIFLKNKNLLNSIRDASKNLKYPSSHNIANIILENLEASSRKTTVVVNIANIPFSGRAHLVTYKIDRNNSNAASFNKRTEPTATLENSGIGGEIDKRVWDYEKEAKFKAAEAVKTYLLDRGIPTEKITELKELLKGDRRELRNILENKNLSTDEKNIFLKAFQEYKKVIGNTYFNRIEAINALNGVSLEGSRKEKEIEIKDGNFAVDISVDPNSVHLLILERYLH